MSFKILQYEFQNIAKYCNVTSWLKCAKNLVFDKQNQFWTILFKKWFGVPAKL